jgi:hypothetical protein
MTYTLKDLEKAPAKKGYTLSDLEQSERPQPTISAHKPSLMDKIRAKFYKGRPVKRFDLPTGTKYVPVEPTREQQPFRTMAGMGAYQTGEYLKGKALYLPELISTDLPEKLAKKIAPAMTLTPQEKAFGKGLATYGSLRTTSTILNPFLKHIPLRESFRLTVGGGTTFGLRSLAEQGIEKLAKGKPIDEGELIFDTLFGSLVGAAEAVAVKGITYKRYREFVKTNPEFKKLVPRKLLFKVDEAFRAAEKGMSKTTLRRVYGKHIKKFADILKNEFGKEAARTALQRVAPAFRPSPEQAVMQKYAERIEAVRQRGGPTAKADVQAIIQQGRMELKQALTTPQLAPEATRMPPVTTKPEITPPPPAKPAAFKTRRGIADVAVVGKAYKAILNTLEPAILTRQRVGRGPVATVMRGAFGKRERARVEFEQKFLEQADKVNIQLEKEFDKYPKQVLEDLLLTRAHGLKGEPLKLQRQAYARLHKAAPELAKKEVRQSIKAIADFNYKFLQEATGLDEGYLFEDFHKAEDYFYGIYKPAKKGVTISKFIKHWKSTDRYIKHKTIPTYNDAKAFGLEIRDPNPVRNLKSEYLDIAQRTSMEWMKNELLRTGKGKYIDADDIAPKEWDGIGDPMRPEPAFEGYRLEPTLAKLINNLIATNKISKSPVNFLRHVNNFIRTVKFIGSAFHLKNIAKQSVADSGYIAFYKKTATRGITTGFRKNDPIFKTPEYKDYIENGGGHKYSLESEAKRAFSSAINRLNRSEQIIWKAGGLPLKIPVSFVDWMFEDYIPKVKYSKYLDRVVEQEKKLGRPLKPSEKQEIIKEAQNLYGMMNERLFGRSGTVEGREL